MENLPTEVLGTSSMNSTWSGIHHFGTRSFSQIRMSSALTAVPSAATTQAIGRSPHLVDATPITAASMTSGWAMISFSSSTELTHSPPDLMRSLVRSTRLM